MKTCFNNDWHLKWSKKSINKNVCLIKSSTCFRRSLFAWRIFALKYPHKKQSKQKTKQKIKQTQTQTPKNKQANKATTKNTTKQKQKKNKQNKTKNKQQQQQNTAKQNVQIKWKTKNITLSNRKMADIGKIDIL